MSELILAASGARKSIFEKFQRDPTNTASMGTGITIAVVGKIATADVADTDIVIVTGNTVSTSTANTSIGALTWSCSGTPAKYMPATRR